jgi:hypothetical protein
MDFLKLTRICGLPFAVAGVVCGCATPVAPNPAPAATTSAGRSDARVMVPEAPDAASDAESEEEEEEEEEEEGEESERDAKADAQGGSRDAGDGGKRDGGKRKHEQTDAGDAGPAHCIGYVDEATPDIELIDCDDFESDDCDSYALEVCQRMHGFVDRRVFIEFVECISDTPGVDFCDEDHSFVDGCENEAKTKACKTHQLACEAYEGCASMTVDACDTAVAVFSETTLQTFGELYDCDTSPTYFVE